jgi:hypothetical protein
LARSAILFLNTGDDVMDAQKETSDANANKVAVRSPALLDGFDQCFATEEVRRSSISPTGPDVPSRKRNAACDGLPEHG